MDNLVQYFHDIDISFHDKNIGVLLTMEKTRLCIFIPPEKALDISQKLEQAYNQYADKNKIGELRNEHQS